MEPVRTWTTTDGETLKARWDRTDESNLDEIRLVSNGENYDIDLKDLSEKDQTYIQQARQKVSKFRKVPAVSQTPVKGGTAGELMVKKVDGVEYAFRWCPPGKFTMGSPKSEWDSAEITRKDYDETQHEVTLSKGFWMLETEVTVGMWESFTKDTGYESQGATPYGWTDSDSEYGVDSKYSWRNPGFSQDDTHPVVCVSWDDAVKFCEWLSKKTGLKISLPTEAQWEYACRAGTKTRYYWGDDEGSLYRYGNYCDRSTGNLDWQDKDHDDGHDTTAPVRSYKPNAWGLYDMSGNVWEWCSDRYDSEYYAKSPSTDPTGPTDGWDRVNRGGGWDGSAWYCRSARRGGVTSDYRRYCLGFRPVVSQ